MEGDVLVISNPPHGTVDARRAAPLLGLIPAEVNLKAHYHVPEIWLAGTDRAGMEEAAGALRDAGLNVVVVAADDLRAVPDQKLVRSFAFGEAGLCLTLDEQGVEARYDHPIIAVTCTPRPPEGGVGGVLPAPVTGERAGISEVSPFLDLYALRQAGVLRVAVYPEIVDFSGLGPHIAPSHAGNMLHFVQEFEKRFTRVRFDRRLMNMQLRRRPGVAVPAVREDTRRGYSYASRGLLELLEAVAPELRDISQAELSSRLAYLTDR